MTESRPIESPFNPKYPVNVETWKQFMPIKELRSGDVCPKCVSTKLDYNALLVLACEECGFRVEGCFT